MTTAQAVGAVSREAAEWYAIDWRAINRNIRRLQVRIVQATKESKWGKVRALQRLLTHSYSGKVFAVRRVTENIVSVFPFRNRVSFKQAFEGLELGEGKPSRPVLRGPGGRKAARLLGSNPLRYSNCPKTGFFIRHALAGFSLCRRTVLRLYAKTNFIVKK